MAVERTDAPNPTDKTKYRITFTERNYDPDDTFHDYLENDPEYRRMIFQHMHEAGELSTRHAEERIRYIARKRREHNPKDQS